MFLFEIVIALLLVGAMLSLVSARIGAPYPALLALAGAAIALIPGVPTVTLDPELALALFVAPTLLDAAFDASPRDLRAQFWPVVSLALGAVALTIIAVAFVARAFVPDLSWAAAITLGAIVAPPDAAAAVTVLRRVNPPHRVLTILEGESLFNDASALLVYRIAAAAAITGTFSGWSVVPMLLITCVGGLVLGVLLARLYIPLGLAIRDVPIAIITQFISTFAVWIIADRIGVSAIIAVVCYAMTVARIAPSRIDARSRIASYAVWEVAVFVLNVLAFVLIGLQLRGILTRLDAPGWRTYLLCAIAVCVAVIVTRIVWVMSHNAIARWRISRGGGAPSSRRQSGPTVGSGLIVSWCGMRGIVSLATALALPTGAAAAGHGSAGTFPYRDLIVLCAFSVVLVTLVVQGLTLRWLIERVGIRDDDVVERELLIARAETARVALRAIEEDPSITSPALRRAYELRLRSAETARADTSAKHGAPQSAEVRTANDLSLDLASFHRRVVQAQRDTLMDLRARSVIGDAAFHAAEEEIDILELTADPRVNTTTT